MISADNSLDALSGGHKSHVGQISRKDRRKADRVQKRTQRSAPPPSKRQKIRHTESIGSISDSEPPSPPQKLLKTARAPVENENPKPKSILKTTKQPDRTATRDEVHFKVESAPRRIIRKPTEDDEVIAFLEKKAGTKRQKWVAQSFQRR